MDYTDCKPLYVADYNSETDFIVKTHFYEIEWCIDDEDDDVELPTSDFDYSIVFPRIVGFMNIVMN